MLDFEAEFKYLERRILRICDICLFPKKIVVRGMENFVVTGPNLIVGNHIGGYKDVGTLLKTVPRRIYFIANQMIFSREEARALVHRHLNRHLKEFAFVAEVLFKPFYAYVVPFVADNIGRIGTIPADMYGSHSDAIYKIQDYMRKGRAVIALQGRGRVHPKDPNPYVKPFRRGAGIVAYNLFRDDGISVPVTPLSFFGTHILWGVPNRIRLNVGPPLFIKDYWGGSETEVVERFRAALEKKVTGLFLESLKW